MVAFRKNRKYAKKSGSKKRLYKRKNPTASFNKKVKAVISTLAENKSADYRGAIPLPASNNANYAVSIVPCTPFTSFLSIPQGVGQGERIGNQIRIKKLTMSGCVVPAGYSAGSNANPRPVFVKLFFLTRKDAPMEIASSVSDIFQYGNSSEGFGVSLQNLMRKVNTDEWMYHTSKTFKVGFSANDGQGGIASNQYYNNNDFKLANLFSIDLTKFCVKNFKFDDNSVNPSTRNIIMYPILYSADSTAVGAGEVLANLQYSLHVEYEDM